MALNIDKFLYIAILLVISKFTIFVVCDDQKPEYNVQLYMDDDGESFKFPSTCQEAKARQYHNNGITLLQIPQHQDPFYVDCIDDPDGGNAWTIILRRQNGHVDFDRNWIDYVIGFGKLTGEYFIGLRKLHALTKFRPQELWVQLETFDGNRTYARYDRIAVGDEKSNYAITDLGTYNGTAGESLSKHRGQPFTTKDADHDEWKEGNCAGIYKGGWWFKACLDSNLNGQYHGVGVTPSQKWGGVYWYDYGDWDRSYSYKYAHMAIRPKVEGDYSKLVYIYRRRTIVS